jgi:AcrR family transcriptional regulator
MTVESLRDRQADLARTAIFETVVRHLEAGDADDVPMDDFAREAGVSRRTLYRYFPNRSDLLAAAGNWIRAEVLELPIEIGDEGIAENFRAAAEKLAKRPELARALLRTQAGQAARAGYRDARVKSIRRAVRAEAPGLSRSDVDRAAGVIAYLCSSNSWIAIQDESGLDASGAKTAVVWAIDTLLARLRDGDHPNAKGGRKP